MPFRVVRFVISPYTVFGIKVPFIQSLARNESKQSNYYWYPESEGTLAVSLVPQSFTIMLSNSLA